MVEKIYPNQNNGMEEDEPREPKVSEQLPKEVFEYLPDFLKNACSIFTDAIERDVFLLGALTVLSGVLPNVFGVYDNKKVGSNIYLFIIAAAGSGKGSLTWVRELVNPIHQYLRENSTEAKNKMLLIPANNSSSGLIEALHDNGERGILMCTEADTLSGALASDWGNYSDVLRAGFHHEFYEMMRRGNKEYKELKRPHLSVLLSGTPAQVFNLIPNAENGLFSRFGFYSFQTPPRMKNVFARVETDFGEHLNKYGNVLLEFYKRLITIEKPIQFKISESQKERFLYVFEDWHNEFLILLGLGSMGSIRRLGLIQFRIAMILSMLNYVEAEELPTEIICTDKDFENAFMIVEVLKKHAFKIYGQYSKQKDVHQFTRKKMQLYNMLPDQEFTRGEALELARKINLSRITFDRFLKTPAFEKVGHGKYRKKINE